MVLLTLTYAFCSQFFNLLKPTGKYTYHKVNIKKCYNVITWIFFGMDLGTNSKFCPTQH